LSNDKVTDTAVIGIQSKKLHTELPRAYVVPSVPLSSLSSAQRQALSKEIADWVATKVAPHKRLRGGVILIDAIPKSPAGKILRKNLRVLAEKEDAETKAKL
jgi:acyl-coenzyme A synthetase/AMP-(fatty) acid ligase